MEKNVAADRKAAMEMVRSLCALSELFVATRCGSPRERDPSELATCASSLGICSEIREEPRSAFALAVSRASGSGAVVIVCGSTYLVGEVMGLL